MNRLFNNINAMALRSEIPIRQIVACTFDTAFIDMLFIQKYNKMQFSLINKINLFSSFIQLSIQF